MDRAVLVVIGNAHQIGQLVSPHHAAGFRDAAGTAVEHRIDQLAAVHQHQGTGAGHRLAGAGGLRLHPAVDLAGHGGLHIPATTAAALLQGIGPSGHRLGLQSSQGPGMGHLAADHTGQIGLDPKLVHHPQAAATATDAEFAPIAALAEPDATRVVIHHRQHGATRQPALVAITVEPQAPPAQAHLQTSPAPLTAGQAAHPHPLLAIGPQNQVPTFVQQHPHARLRHARHSHRRVQQRQSGQAEQSGGADDWSGSHGSIPRQPSVPRSPRRCQMAAWQLRISGLAGHLSRYQFRRSHQGPQCFSGCAAAASACRNVAVRLRRRHPAPVPAQ